MRGSHFKVLSSRMQLNQAIALQETSISFLLPFIYLLLLVNLHKEIFMSGAA